LQVLFCENSRFRLNIDTGLPSQGKRTFQRVLKFRIAEIHAFVVDGHIET